MIAGSRGLVLENPTSFTKLDANFYQSITLVFNRSSPATFSPSLPMFLSWSLGLLPRGFQDHSTMNHCLLFLEAGLGLDLPLTLLQTRSSSLVFANLLLTDIVYIVLPLPSLSVHSKTVLEIPRVREYCLSIKFPMVSTNAVSTQGCGKDLFEQVLQEELQGIAQDQRIFQVP